MIFLAFWANFDHYSSSHHRPVASCVVNDACLLKKRATEKGCACACVSVGVGGSVMIRKEEEEEEEEGLGKIPYGLI